MSAVIKHIVNNDYVFQQKRMGTQHSSTVHFSSAVAPNTPELKSVDYKI